jgi:hypothetical protein
MSTSPALLLGTRKGFFAVDPANSENPVRHTAFLGDEANLVVKDPRDGAFYAALYLGHFGVKLHRSEDGGASWQEIATPVYPERPAGVEPEMNPFSGKETPWKLLKIWALQPAGSDEPGVLWCGTIPGGLFRSENRGESWELCRPLWDRPERKKWFGGGEDFAGIHSILIDPKDSRHLACGVSCAGVWRTRDGGQTWAQSAHGMRAEYMPPDMAFDPEAQDPHIIASSAATPEIVWAQHHNGIFKSSDGGLNWTECKNVPVSAFGFAVVTHPHDARTAWFVPAVKDETRIPVDGALCVLRTRDGGETWDILREGLPQVHAYDLVFRHALDVDPSGERLAFGSTTGNLYVSEDGGDSWRCVSSTLPPIYSVRWA